MRVPSSPELQLKFNTSRLPKKQRRFLGIGAEDVISSPRINCLEHPS